MTNPGRAEALLAALHSQVRQNEVEMSPLQKEAYYGDAEKARLLLEQGAWANEPNRNGWTAMFTAAWHGHVEVVSLLRDHDGIWEEGCAPYGHIPLHLAAIQGNEEMVELMLTRGYHDTGFINASPSSGETSLWMAACCGHSRVVELLLAHGANVHRADRYGNTPLHAAAASGNAQIVRLLLEHGADIRALNHEQCPLSVLECAELSNNRELVAWLRTRLAEA